MSDSMHPTERQLRGFVAGDLAASEVASTARHIAACPRCAAAARAGYDLDAGAVAVRAEIMNKRPARRLWMAVAAMLAIAVIGGTWFFAHRPPSPAAPAAVPSARTDWNAITRAALASGDIIEPGILRELRLAPSSLRSSAPQSASGALRPTGLVVESDRPRFSWNAVEGATSYRLLLAVRGRGVARSAALPINEWQPPAPLVRGAVYEWQVIASTPRGEIVLPPPDAPRALFAVLSAPVAEEIAAAKGERPNDSLLLGLLYARAGVVDRAEDLLRPYPALHRRVAAWH